MRGPGGTSLGFRGPALSIRRSGVSVWTPPDSALNEPHRHVTAPRQPPLRPSISSAASPPLRGGDEEPSISSSPHEVGGRRFATANLQGGPARREPAEHESNPRALPPLRPSISSAASPPPPWERQEAVSARTDYGLRATSEREAFGSAYCSSAGASPAVILTAGSSASSGVRSRR